MDGHSVSRSALANGWTHGYKNERFQNMRQSQECKLSYLKLHRSRRWSNAIVELPGKSSFFCGKRNSARRKEGVSTYVCVENGNGYSVNRIAPADGWMPGYEKKEESEHELNVSAGTGKLSIALLLRMVKRKRCTAWKMQFCLMWGRTYDGQKRKFRNILQGKNRDASTEAKQFSVWPFTISALI